MTKLRFTTYPCDDKSSFCYVATYVSKTRPKTLLSRHVQLIESYNRDTARSIVRRLNLLFKHLDGRRFMEVGSCVTPAEIKWIDICGVLSLYCWCHRVPRRYKVGTEDWCLAGYEIVGYLAHYLAAHSGYDKNTARYRAMSDDDMMYTRHAICRIIDEIDVRVRQRREQENAK